MRATGQAQSRSGHVTLAVTTAALLAANAIGWEYYRLPLAERVRDPMHAWLRPSGYVGQSAGVLAALIFAFLWLYPLRKRFKALAWTGAVGAWLDVHITAALTLPLLLCIHAAWRFGGVIGLGFDAMMIVVASGVVGRYLYVRIPRSRSGLELTLEEVAAERRSLVTELAATTRLDPRALEATLRGTGQATAPAGIVGALASMLTADLTRWRTQRALRRRWSELPGGASLDPAALQRALELATREMALAHQVQLLAATHRVFRWWHVLHRPIAVTAAVAVIVHVTVVVLVGATWFW